MCVDPKCWLKKAEEPERKAKKAAKQIIKPAWDFTTCKFAGDASAGTQYPKSAPPSSQAPLIGQP
jgi:hypothetical protein